MADSGLELLALEQAAKPRYLPHQKSPLKHNHQTQKAEFTPFPDPETNDFNQKA